MNKELFQKIETLQNMLLDRSTGKGGDEELYQKLRAELCQNSFIKNKLPDFLLTNRTLPQFWQFIKNKHDNYSDRRQYLWEVFSIALNYIESYKTSPVAEAASVKLSKPDQDHINFEWKKALERKQDDPEAAITTSRTLIETVCKYILDELNIEYDESVELPKLYKLTAQQLNLAQNNITRKYLSKYYEGVKLL